MNPWEIVGWVAAGGVAVAIATFVALVVANVEFELRRLGRKSTEVFRGRGE